jgi:hypothetical protein
MDLDQGYRIQFYRILYLKIKGVDLLLKRKADLLVLAPKWCLVWEGRSEFYELSYWIRVYNKVLKYPTGYLNVWCKNQGLYSRHFITFIANKLECFSLAGLFILI